ncbi:MAG: hypothetical protein AAF304_06945, partial [Pseudomonadota bacterium]
TAQLAPHKAVQIHACNATLQAKLPNCLELSRRFLTQFYSNYKKKNRPESYQARHSISFFTMAVSLQVHSAAICKL